MTHTLFYVIIASTDVSWNCVGISRPTGTVCADLNRLEHNYVGGEIATTQMFNAGSKSSSGVSLIQLVCFGGMPIIIRFKWLSFCYDAWQVSLTVKYPFFF